MLDGFEIKTKKALMLLLKKFTDTKNLKEEINYVYKDNGKLVATNTKVLIILENSEVINRLFKDDVFIDVHNKMLYERGDEFRFPFYDRIILKDTKEVKKIDSDSFFDALIFDAQKNFSIMLDYFKFTKIFVPLEKYAIGGCVMKNISNNEPIQFEFQIDIFNSIFKTTLIVMPLTKN